MHDISIYSGINRTLLNVHHLQLPIKTLSGYLFAANENFFLFIYISCMQSLLNWDINMTVQYDCKGVNLLSVIAFNLVKLTSLAFLCSFLHFQVLIEDNGPFGRESDSPFCSSTRHWKSLCYSNHSFYIHFKDFMQSLQLYQFAALCCGLLTALHATLMSIIMDLL